jgi:predicted DNA binding CopG/RHH family protein
METTRKPRGRKGGRKFGSKDKTPRTSKELTEKVFLRMSKALMERIERAASLQGDPVPEYLRDVLDAHVPQ